jgi:hypothetical protein
LWLCVFVGRDERSGVVIKPGCVEDNGVTDRQNK